MADFKRTKIVKLLAYAEIGSKATVMGWVRTKRESKGGFSFVEINDGSCMSNLQVIASDRLPNYREEISRIQTGCSVRITGTVVASPGKGQKVELEADAMEVLGWADPSSYPLQKKRHTFEFLRGVAHLRPRTNTFGAVARVRNALSMAIHAFFQERGFLYIHTPIITGSDCEGAGAMFKVTALDLEKIPFHQGRADLSKDFFGGPAFLTVSGQLEAEVYALSMGDIYTFGPTFRAENSNTPRHLAEFWMVEPEMAFCDLEGNVELSVSFLKYIFAHVLRHCEEDMDFFNRFIDSTIIETLESLVEQDFQRVTYTDAMDVLSKAEVAFEFPVSWGSDLQAEHERYLCERVFKRPMVLTDYPKQIKPFYMKVEQRRQDGSCHGCPRSENRRNHRGSQREDDHDVLLSRMKETGIDPESYWWYLELRKFGTVPHAGFGLGLERLVQFVTGMANIRDVIPFPRTPGNVSF